MNVFSVIANFDTVDAKTAEAFTKAADEYAKSNNSGLPRGLQSGIYTLAVIVSQKVDQTAIDYVSKAPPSQWAAIALPVIYNLENDSLHYFTGTPIWGFAMYRGLRKYVVERFGS